MHWRFWQRRDKHTDDLVEAVHQSLIQQTPFPRLTNEQALELDRRAEAYRQKPDDVVPWDSLKKDIEDKWLKNRTQSE